MLSKVKLESISENGFVYTFLNRSLKRVVSVCTVESRFFLHPSALLLLLHFSLVKPSTFRPCPYTVVQRD